MRSAIAKPQKVYPGTDASSYSGTRVEGSREHVSQVAYSFSVFQKPALHQGTAGTPGYALGRAGPCAEKGRKREVLTPEGQKRGDSQLASEQVGGVGGVSGAGGRREACCRG